MAQDPSMALISREGYQFYISTRIIDFSNFIKDKIEGKPLLCLLFIRILDLEFEEIPVDVPSAILERVKEFHEHHEYKDIKSVKKPIKTSNFTTIASEWDHNFFKLLSEEEMSELLLVSY